MKSLKKYQKEYEEEKNIPNPLISCGTGVVIMIDSCFNIINSNSIYEMKKRKEFIF
jgi:hypothetical protein